MPQDFTVDRASKKYVLGSNGFLKEYANDEPAIEFNPDGSYKGVLVEPQSVNEARASEDLDNATYWNTTNTSITNNAETDPKGGTNSFLLSETAASAQHYFITGAAFFVSIGSGETWTQSIFVKKGDGVNAPDIVQLTHGTATFGALQYANFDISVGNVTSGTVTASTGGTAGIRYYGNGWYRIFWTATSTSAGSVYIVLSFVNNNPTGSRLPTYTGQTDANVFVWGAQLEESPIATSYISTTTGAVTRLKDDIYLTSASSLIGQTEGTLFVEVDWRDASGFRRLLTASDGSVTNFTTIITGNTNQVRAIARVNNSEICSIQETGATNTGVTKIAFAYKTNDFELYKNGSSLGTDTTGNVAFTSPVDEINLGAYYNRGEQVNMWIRAVALFNTRLSDAECIALTT